MKILVVLLFALLFFVNISAQAPRISNVSGRVKDEAGKVIADASITLLSSRQSVLAATKTKVDGTFDLPQIAWGSYELLITAEGFGARRAAVNSPLSSGFEVILAPAALTDEVSVTAEFGTVTERDSTPQKVTVINEQNLQQRAKTVLAQAANEEAGVSLQRTSPTIGAIYVRGLTGNKVNTFIDGVRVSNTAARGGINTFFNLNDASNLRSIEILRGPNSSQFGSDAIGGSVQLNSSAPLFTAKIPEWHGSQSTNFNTADLGFGGNFKVTYGRPDFSVVFNVLGHRSNTLRTGQAIDTHAAVTRFLGLPSDIFGKRLSDTAFSNYGGLFRMVYAPKQSEQISVHYQRGQQDGGKRYDQTLGGDGNLIADLRNLMANFFYTRYEKFQAGWFDNIAATYSLNTQREERVNQGGNGNPNGAITHQYERTTTHGFQFQAAKNWTTRNTLVVGGDVYRDAVKAPAFAVNPVTQVVTITRPRVPNRATYLNAGIFVQDSFNAIPERLRIVGSARYSFASYRVRAENSPLVNGKRLWADDALCLGNATGRIGAVLTLTRGLNFSAHVSRGFRVPHITDLGTLGLTGSGFEVAAPDIANLNATLGSTADANAINTGLSVTQQAPEISLSYDFGLHLKRGRIDADLVYFSNSIKDNITKQTLILPSGAVGKLLGSEVITAQLPTGAVFVAAATNPVLVRANFDDALIRGLEQSLEIKISSRWSLRENFTYIYAQDVRTGFAPSIEGGTPAPNGSASLRYQVKRFWLEPYLTGALRNMRLSSLDLEDRRTGAVRTRSSIQNFFRNGATARGLISTGADGRFGTADDTLKNTNETLAQVQDRVLGVGVNSAPLFRAIPGYATINFRGGFHLSEKQELLFDFENLFDKNYRGISWGLDAPGRGLSLRYQLKF